jgi:hypothetical protein
MAEVHRGSLAPDPYRAETLGRGTREDRPFLPEQVRARQQLAYTSLVTRLSDIEAQTKAQIINNMK